MDMAREALERTCSARDEQTAIEHSYVMRSVYGVNAHDEDDDDDDDDGDDRRHADPSRAQFGYSFFFLSLGQYQCVSAWRAAWRALKCY